MTATITPTGCRWCGIPQYSHWVQWTEEAGSHAWEHPTDAQILARMRTRRAARIAARTRGPVRNPGIEATITAVDGSARFFRNAAASLKEAP